MTIGYQVYNQQATYFVTFTIVDWVDLLSRKVYRDIVIESLRYCISYKGLKVYSYVIMTNHIHLIIQSDGSNLLSDIIRDFKKYTAKQFIETILKEPESRREWLLKRFAFNAVQHSRNSNYQIWTHENHAIEINSHHFFEQKNNYILQNPVRAGWVDKPEDYIYSSAYELCGRGNKIEISFW
jgi:REP element-mobilizing transposase RayT